MSTDCESVVSPSLVTENLPHSLPLPSNSVRSESHNQSGISYEGRVSLISPLAAVELEHPSPQFVGSTLAAPFHSHGGFGYISHDQFSFSDERRRHGVFPFHSTPGSSRDYDLYHHYSVERPGEGGIAIKQEVVERDYQSYSNDFLKNCPETAARLNPLFSPASKCPTQSVDRNYSANKGHTPEEHAKEPLIVTSTPSSETPVGREYLVNGDNSPEPESPPVFPDNDEGNGGGQCSSEVHYPNESREGGEPTMSIMNSSFDESPEYYHHGENSKSLKCQFCSFSTDSKPQFSSHLNCHFDHKCMKCEFTTQTTDQLKEHLREEHDITLDDQDFETTRVPRVNSQGKVKTFKCKQCDYIAVTKSDFWKHAKTHIKSEKLLTCNKCAFVTEYKHHLEYHLRNHFGSKPFKCNKCTYSCVNKSMLNSHMKSHSNIYQYRCSDCTYATKYCHSLKLHLRKYGHTPAMVLNPDGTPNPVPIIDIYGTRRGPKLKKDENGMPILPPQYQLQAQFVRAHMEVTGTIPPAPTAPPEKASNHKTTAGNGMHLPIQSSLIPNSYANIPNMPPHHNFASFIPNEFKEMTRSVEKSSNAKESTNESSDKEEALNASKSPEVEESLKCDICSFTTQNKDILAHHMLLHAKEEEEAAEKRESQRVVKENNESNQRHHGPREVNPVVSPYRDEQNLHLQGMTPPLSSAQSTLQEYIVRAMNPLLYPPMMGGQNFLHPAIDFKQQLQRILYESAKRDFSLLDKSHNLSPSPIKQSSNQVESTVLNLSKDQTVLERVHPFQANSTTTSPPFLPSPPTSEISTPPSKNRRKGRAYKLERIALRLSGSGEEGESSCNESSEPHPKEPEEKRSKGNSVPPLLVPLAQPESKERSSKEQSKWGEAHQCQYCDIAFKDVVMYTMHMGYHGYKDPFTCNMCGYDAADKLSFFLHIGRSSHL